jgi:hypothetical protein
MIRTIFVMSSVLSSVANAQTVRDGAPARSDQVNGNNIVCVDNDCHYGGNSNEASGYFAAKTFVAIQQLNGQITALMNSQSSLLSTLVQKSNDTNALVAQQINTFNQDLRNSINASFDRLPQDLINSDAIKQLRADILKQVDQKLKTQAPPGH